MSRKLRQPALATQPWPSRPKSKTVAPVKAEPKIGPPSLADHFQGSSEFIAHFRTLPPDQREHAIGIAKFQYVEVGEASEREPRRRRLDFLIGIDNEMRLNRK